MEPERLVCRPLWWAGWAALVCAASVARAENLWVTLPENPSPCSYEQLARAVAAQRPSVAVALGSHVLVAGQVQLVLHRGGTAWTLEMQALGHAPLERELPPVGTGCVALSQTAAFMATRYLEDLQAQATVVALPAAPPVPSPAPPSVPWHAGLGLGLNAEANQTGLTAALQLDLFVRRGIWELCLSVAGLLPSELAAQPSDDDDSSRDVQDLEVGRVELIGGIRLPAGPGMLRLGAGPGAELSWASTAYGRSEHLPPVFSARTAVGARVGWALAVLSRLEVGVSGEGRVLIGDKPGVDDPGSGVAVDATLSLSASYLIF